MSRRSDRWRDNVGRDDGKTGGAEWNNVEIGGIYRARYWKELVDTMGTFSGIVGREEGSDGKDERARVGRIVLVHRRVPATNRGCIIHSLGYTRTGIALRPLCVCVVSEQYRHAKVARPRECDLRLNCRGYSLVTAAYTRALLRGSSRHPESTGNPRNRLTVTVPGSRK